jgi:valyl-tRNA synthetase
LWTFSTLGWPDKTRELEEFHSTDVMVTGHDIITFWVSRMIMMTLKFMDEIPFKKVYVTGLVTDAEGQKMSKSKGNGLDPLDIVDGVSLDELIAKRTSNMLQPKLAARIEKATRKEFPEGIESHGTDALRFTFYSIATSSRTIRFDMKRVEGYRNFCNKLWNAANFVFMNTLPVDDNLTKEPLELSVVDRWIWSEFQRTQEAVEFAMQTYRYDLAAKAIYEFVWDEFCDWYLELCKPILNNEAAPKAARAAKATLLQVLENTLRLAHPFIPFITEEIWQQLPTSIRDSGDTIMTQPFPNIFSELRDEQAEADIAWIKSVVTATRNIRGEMDISPAKPIPILFSNGDDADKTRLEQHSSLLEFLIRPEKLEWWDSSEEPPLSATHLVGDMQVLVPMAGLIDKDAELARLDKDIEKKEKDQARTKGKLNNPNFVDKAPADVVQKEKDKLIELDTALQQLLAQKARIETL